MVSIIICMTILFSFLFIHFLYRDIYVKDIEQSLLQEGNKIASHYEGGEITDELKQNVAWHNSISESEILLVDNPRELSACLPFEMNHQALITEDERRKLLAGKHLVKVGYEERFERNIMGVVIPLLDQERLKGIIYLYLPLSPIEEVFNKSTPILLLAGVLFFLFMVVFGNKLVRSLVTPIREMEAFSQHIAKGDFSKRLPVESKDELGHLALAFNQMTEALENQDQQKKEFLANVSHELRTPLSYVKGYSEVLKDEMYQSKEEALRYVNLIHRESDRMHRLVKDLLDLAQLEADMYPMKNEPLVLAQVLDDTIEKFIPAFKQKQLAYEVNLDWDVIMNGDYDRLSQVFYNLLDNAVKYNRDNGKVSISLVVEGDEICISVKDTGIGISPEDITRLGERFFRADKARTRTKGGTGLGLAIVKQIVQRHNGKMDIMSVLNEGTTVMLRFPLEHFE
jgi:signal transduction histidine kinase